MNYWITYSDKNYMKNTDILLSLLSKFSKHFLEKYFQNG